MVAQLDRESEAEAEIFGMAQLRRQPFGSWYNRP